MGIYVDNEILTAGDTLMNMFYPTVGVQGLNLHLA